MVVDEVRMPAHVADRFEELALIMRPEHLSKNGKATEEQLIARWRHARTEWGFLEDRIGRRVKMTEVSKQW